MEHRHQFADTYDLISSYSHPQSNKVKKNPYIRYNTSNEQSQVHLIQQPSTIEFNL